MANATRGKSKRYTWGWQTLGSDADDKSFVSEDGMGENALCLLEESVFVFDGSAEMSDAELSHPCISGQSGCLKGGGMHGLLGSQSTFMKISGFVVKQVDALDDVLQPGQIDSIATIGEGAGRRGRCGQAFVRDDGSVLRRPRRTSLDVVYLADGYAIGINNLPADVWQVWFLAEEKAAGGKSVLQGDAVDRDAAVFVDKRMPLHINRMKEDFILNVAVVSALQEIEELAHLLRPVDMELGSPAQEVHRTYQPGQPEDVVAMIVTDEDVADVHHRKPHLLHLRLNALATIYHEVFAPHVQYLRGGLMASGRLG